MSKPIKLTEELLEKIQQEFIQNVRSMKLFDGKLTYTKNFKWDDTSEDKAAIRFTPAAFAKMVMLLQEFDSEVAWHGVAYRSDDKPAEFVITDILVYPQVVSGSTVNTDQEEYTNWLYGLDDEVFNNLKMQGHSHVNFGTTPSGVDTTHQEQILSQLDEDMFYIFMIWNKKFEHTIKIFDLQNNTLYEDSEIVVSIIGENTDLDAFIADAKKLVKKKLYTTGFSNTPNTGGNSGYYNTKGKTQTKKKPAKSKTNKTDAELEEKLKDPFYYSDEGEFNYYDRFYNYEFGGR